MSHQSIAIIGGTGPQGRGLAYRLAGAGHPVVLGSRDATRAAAAADELGARLGAAARIRGASNADAARAADVVLLAVPYDGHDELVATLRESVADKIVVSCVNPLGFDRGGPFGLDLPRSAAETAAELLPDARVVGAFHHLSAVTLIKDEPLPEDVLVCGDDPAAKRVVIGLAAAVTGRPGVDAGRLRLARQLEPLTAVLISINRAYKAHSGVRITGLPAVP